MQQSRPTNLNLFTIHFPIPAIVSILHRISGVLLFLCIPILLWALQWSLTEEGFSSVKSSAHSFCARFIFWLILIPFCYHLIAGIRHLLTDIHLGSTLRGGRFGAKMTLILSVILVILAGIWLW